MKPENNTKSTAIPFTSITPSSMDIISRLESLGVLPASSGEESAKTMRDIFESGEHIFNAPKFDNPTYLQQQIANKIAKKLVDGEEANRQNVSEAKKVTTFTGLNSNSLSIVAHLKKELVSNDNIDIHITISESDFSLRLRKEGKLLQITKSESFELLVIKKFLNEFLGVPRHLFSLKGNRNSKNVELSRVNHNGFIVRFASCLSKQSLDIVIRKLPAQGSESVGFNDLGYSKLQREKIIETVMSMNKEQRDYFLGSQ